MLQLCLKIFAKLEIDNGVKTILTYMKLTLGRFFHIKFFVSFNLSAFNLLSPNDVASYSSFISTPSLYSLSLRPIFDSTVVQAVFLFFFESTFLFVVYFDPLPIFLCKYLLSFSLLF